MTFKFSNKHFFQILNRKLSDLLYFRNVCIDDVFNDEE